jgi:hypothetical protein
VRVLHQPQHDHGHVVVSCALSRKGHTHTKFGKFPSCRGMAFA